MRTFPKIQVGDKFGRLTVTNLNSDIVKNNIKHECVCECGTIKNIRGDYLKNGNTVSCGCFRKKFNFDTINKNKNENEYLEYKAFQSMKQRCLNPNNKSYKNYGGRGIKICERWMERNGFNNFIEDMGHKPSAKHSIDRMNNDEDYSPENCRWTTQAEQMRNTSKTLNITFRNKTQCLKDWCQELNINYHKAHDRFKAGNSIEDILSDSKYTKNNRLLEFNGQIKSLQDWATQYNINQSALNRRLFRGWTIEKSLTTPMNPQNNKKPKNKLRPPCNIS